MSPVLYIVIPCYNEEQVLPITSGMFLDTLKDMVSAGKISPDSRIMFVDDGSRDDTWKIISDLARTDKHFIGIRQSRNRGHQSSLLAGLMESLGKADAVVSIDCDGQDDITAMKRMVDCYLDGAEVVYGVRSSRKKDSFFKRFTAESFYRFLALMGVEVVFNHADYRLVSSRVLKEFARFGEVNLFLRGMFPLVGFKSTTVEYERSERMAGKSHYPLRKMLGLASDGVTSLSVKPLRIAAWFGFVISFLSLIGVIWSVIATLAFGHSNNASVISTVCLMGGVELIAVGVLGEYVGKIYSEVKRRPRYIISERTTDEGGDPREE